MTMMPLIKTYITHNNPWLSQKNTTIVKYHDVYHVKSSLGWRENVCQYSGTSVNISCR